MTTNQNQYKIITLKKYTYKITVVRHTDGTPYVWGASRNNNGSWETVRMFTGSEGKSLPKSVAQEAHIFFNSFNKTK